VMLSHGTVLRRRLNHRWAMTNWQFLNQDQTNCVVPPSLQSTQIYTPNKQIKGVNLTETQFYGRITDWSSEPQLEVEGLQEDPMELLERAVVTEAGDVHCTRGGS
jgi:hypothetical protein